MSETNKEYIPALRFRVLTPFYDAVQRWLVHDEPYKRRLIEQAKIQPGQRVLDIGCGTGTLAIMIKQAHPDAQVFGLDADPEMLGVARAKAAQLGVDVTFDQGMTFSLPYADASLDRVLSTLMIHHLKTPDKERTAREVYRALRPGGQLHILDFGAPYTLYGRLLKPFLHEFEEVNDNVDGLLPEIFARPGMKTQITGNYWTFFGDLAFLSGQK